MDLILFLLLGVRLIATSSGFLLKNWIKFSSCFGCHLKPTPIIAVDEPAKGLRIRGQTVRKPTISDGFWSSSTCDPDNNAVQSQRSMTSVSTLHQLFYHSSELSPAVTHPEFVNQNAGLILWNESRIQWVGGSRSKKQNKQKQEPKLNWNATYDSLLGTKQPFPRRVPLSEMVEFLVKVWEHEEMYG